MKKVKVKKFKDAYLKKPIEESLEKLEQFLEKPKGELVYYSGNLQEKVRHCYCARIVYSCISFFLFEIVQGYRTSLFP